MIRDKMECVRAMLEEADRALQNSYAPYSGFQVAAALLTKDLKIYTGVNIENASYPASLCAERTAFAKAVSEGAKEFEGIAVIGGPGGDWHKEPCPPCGICRQVMREFTDPVDFEIVLGTGEAAIKIYTLDELLPLSFGPDHLCRI